MELEVILGNPVKIARAQGYEMPRLQSMYALLKVRLSCIGLLPRPDNLA